MDIDKSKKVNYVIDVAALLWRRRWLIIVLTVIAAASSFFLSTRVKGTYTASCTFLPAQQSSLSSSLLSQYGGLASSAGLIASRGSGYSSAVKIEAILTSRSFAEKMVRELDLASILNEGPEKAWDVPPKTQNISPEKLAVMMFQKSVMKVVSDMKTSLITISVRTRKPELSREIADKALDLLQKELRERTLTAGGKNIAVLERQLADQERKVRAIQDRLVAYQKKNKLIIPSIQSQAGLQFYQALIRQKVSLEIEISGLESTLSADNTKVISIQNQLAVIEEQISAYESSGTEIAPSMERMPSLMMEYDQMVSDLKFATKMYGSIFGSLEIVKLQAAFESPFIEIIDRARIPEKPSGPSRLGICAMGALRGFALSLILAFLVEGIRKLRADLKIRAIFVSAKRKE